MLRLGIIGTMVWDRIYARDLRSEPVEEWGGISYALAAASAARPEGWSIVPILRIGRDLEHQAIRFLSDVPGLDLGAIKIVDEPNNRVELHYRDRERRTEKLSGGVGPWTWTELQPILEDIDALYINFISGFELTLETAQQIRLSFDGPIYADLHSLMLGVAPDGERVPHALASWREWLRCFDVIQLNEDELTWVADVAIGDPWTFAAAVVSDQPKALLITLGSRGAAYVASPSMQGDPMSWRHNGALRLPPPLAVPGATRSSRIPPAETIDGDPTGCGDVWGATCVSRLLAGDTLDDAMRSANVAAARNVGHRGATGLHHHLLGRIGT